MWDKVPFPFYILLAAISFECEETIKVLCLGPHLLLSALWARLETSWPGHTGAPGTGETNTGPLLAPTQAQEQREALEHLSRNIWRHRPGAHVALLLRDTTPVMRVDTTMTG